MAMVMLQLDPARLSNPDLDIRYALPDLLVERSSGRLTDDGYDYPGDGSAPVPIALPANRRRERYNS
jgi:hypothetical protein